MVCPTTSPRACSLLTTAVWWLSPEPDWGGPFRKTIQAGLPSPPVHQFLAGQRRQGNKGTSRKMIIKITATEHTPTESPLHFLQVMGQPTVTPESGGQWEAVPELCPSQDFLTFVTMGDIQLYSLHITQSLTAPYLCSTHDYTGAQKG